MFQDDAVSTESVKLKLLSIANKQLNKNNASNVESVQSLDELDLKRIIQSRVVRNL